MSDKIFPRNLTAKASRQVVGNPVNTRLESGVGNCYPGLEFDQRNLDRRFFPGLVFEFVSQADAPNADEMLTGARLLRVEQRDPELTTTNPERAEAAKQLRTALQSVGDDLSKDVWYLDFLEQGKKHIPLYKTENG